MENKVFVRTTGKELSFLGLYAYDIGSHPLPEILDMSWLKDLYAYDKEEGWLPNLAPSDRGIFRHAEEILRGVLNELPTLDQEIAPLVKNRPFERILAVDKAILRLGAYLIIFDRTIPSEAIFSLCGEFADLYGEDETPSYIQGILGSLAKKWRTPQKGEG
ncbi:transcription antitermination protein NusB [Thermospira aquatica]|uniref:NusB/RsmB/TIM44 domain-containing protein n=1 Tax=Thermospira aquatica TaxID=2828656 RepID=A0AAX3BE70_9SPIR|nr:transcription antitermination factor NusB [Thermospira aquatica]URA10515.1 hypothetical protein KDW03_01555 [Thermospira aquatica]